MSPQTPLLERAYQLARSGLCVSLTEIRAQLRHEGYEQVHTQTSSSWITVPLLRMCAEAARGLPVELAAVEPPMRMSYRVTDDFELGEAFPYAAVGGDRGHRPRAPVA
jgi:hypothetical protein